MKDRTDIGRPAPPDLFDPEYEQKRAAFVQWEADRIQAEGPLPGGQLHSVSIGVGDELRRREELWKFAEGRKALLGWVGLYAALVIALGWRYGIGRDPDMRFYFWLGLALPFAWIAWSRDGDTRTARRKMFVQAAVGIAALLGAGLFWRIMTR